MLVLAGVVAGEDDRFAKDVPQPLRGKINEAIDKGVAYLKSIQRPDGYWGGQEDPQHFLRWSDHSQTAGMTALCLYALGASGVTKEDPAAFRGLNFLFEHRDYFDGGRGEGPVRGPVTSCRARPLPPAARGHRGINAAPERH